MPCLNEEQTIAICIKKAQFSIERYQLNAEILVSDNGSADNSVSLAIDAGARVIIVKERGYGNVLRAGIEHAKGQYIIMADSDDSYDFSEIFPFVLKLREGYDLVMGNRFLGGIEPNSMPFLHRYLGNPVLSFVGRLFFKIPVGDFHCGIRGVNRQAMASINLFTTGMEFASEMIIKCSLSGQKITEIPVRLYPDGRSRPPHLRTWHDGWRHLRFLFLYCPTWLFLYPGSILMVVGIMITTLLLPGPVPLGHVTFDVHTMVYSASAIVIGFQTLTFYFCSKLFAAKKGFDYKNRWVGEFNHYFTLERGLIAGGIMLILGLSLTLYAIHMWIGKSFGTLQPSKMLRLIIPAVTSLMLGTQIIFNSFFASMLNLNLKYNKSIPVVNQTKEQIILATIV